MLKVSLSEHLVQLKKSLQLAGGQQHGAQIALLTQIRKHLRPFVHESTQHYYADYVTLYSILYMTLK